MDAVLKMVIRVLNLYSFLQIAEFKNSSLFNGV